jgi:beta-lactamase regulating signal transducer with metallopeptidase domain
MNGLEALWANPAVQAITWALVHFLWQGALVGLAAAGALVLLKNGSASVRYSVALGALLVLLLCPIGTALWMSGIGGEEPLAREASPAVVADGAPVQVPDAPPVLSANARDLLPAALPWFFGLWLAGVALLSVYHLGGWTQARRWTRRATRPLPEEWRAKLRVLARRLGIGREVGLLESAAAQVPAVIGWLQPVILVPASALAGLSPRQLEAILAHELAHVRRHDYLINLLQTVVETLLFYHPAVWWVSAQIRRERENCCDDLAVAVCGDRLVYARALADLEGLRVSPPRLAMAADGGSLVGRIRRLAGVPARESRRSWVAGALALSLLPAGAAINFSGISGSVEMDDPASSYASLESAAPAAPQAPRAERAESEDKDDYPVSGRGMWTAERKDGDRVWLQMSMRSAKNQWSSSTTFRASELQGLGAGPDVRFQLRRDAGTFNFEGRFKGELGTGFFDFQPNPQYASQMRSLGYEVREKQLLEMALHDVSLAFAREMKGLGYGKSIDELVEFRIFGVSSDFIHEMESLGYRDLSGDKLVECRVHAVSPEYIRSMAQAGFRNLSLDDLVDFRVHGVSLEFMREMADLGYRDLPADGLVDFRIHGVSREYIQELAEAGYRNLPADTLTEFRIHGVNTEFIRDAAKRGYKNLTPDDLVELKIMGRLEDRDED